MFQVLKWEVRKKQEKTILDSRSYEKTVAPRTGAWIETESRHGHKAHAVSPLAQGRGLKQQIQQETVWMY